VVLPQAHTRLMDDMDGLHRLTSQRRDHASQHASALPSAH